MVRPGLEPRIPAGHPVLKILDALPAQIRPSPCAPPLEDMLLLTGDSWAPVMCELIQGAQSRIELAAYSVSTRWPRLATDKFNVYQALLAAPARGVDCRCVLATHKRTSATGRFNHWSAKKMRAAGWSVRLAPRGRLLHLKLMVVDSSLVVVGSHNIAHAAASSNIDLSVCIGGVMQAWPFRKIFNNVYSDAGLAEK